MPATPTTRELNQNELKRIIAAKLGFVGATPTATAMYGRDPAKLGADALRKIASDTSPTVGGYGEGIARLGAGVASSFANRAAERRAMAADQAIADAVNNDRLGPDGKPLPNTSDEVSAAANAGPQAAAPPPQAMDEVASAGLAQGAPPPGAPPPGAAPPGAAPPPTKTLPDNFADLPPEVQAKAVQVARAMTTTPGGGAPPPNPPQALPVDGQGKMGVPSGVMQQPGPVPSLPPQGPSQGLPPQAGAMGPPGSYASPLPIPDQGPRGSRPPGQPRRLPPPQPIPPQAGPTPPLSMAQGTPMAGGPPQPSPSPLPSQGRGTTGAINGRGQDPTISGSGSADSLNGGDAAAAGLDYDQTGIHPSKRVVAMSVRDMKDVPFSAVKDLIASKEAPDSIGGYNAQAYNTGKGNAAGLQPLNLTGMSLGQIYDYQRGPMRAKTRGQRGAGDIGSTGVGRYQFESRTLQSMAQKAFGDNWQNVAFTPENQDKLAETLFDTVKGNPTMLRNTWAAFNTRKVPVALGGGGSEQTDTPQGGDGGDISGGDVIQPSALPEAPPEPQRPTDRARVRSERLDLARRILRNNPGMRSDLLYAATNDLYEKGYDEEQKAREQEYTAQTQMDREEYMDKRQGYREGVNAIRNAGIAQGTAKDKYGYDVALKAVEAGYKEQEDARKAASDLAVANAKTAAKGGKNLPAGINKSITTQAQALSRITEAMQGFKKDYFNFGNQAYGAMRDKVTNLASSVGLSSKTAEDRVAWRKAFNMMQNIDRHELFGSALSAPEAKAWDAASINEGTSSAIAARNLQIRYQILKDNLGKAVASAKGGGYDQEQIDALVGSGLTSTVDNPEFDAERGITRVQKKAAGQPRKAATGGGQTVTRNGHNYEKRADGWYDLGPA